MRNRTVRWAPVALAVAAALAASGPASGATKTTKKSTKTTKKSTKTTKKVAVTTAPNRTVPASVAPATTAATGDFCTAARKGGTVTMGTLLNTTSLDPTVALGSGSAGGIELAAFYDQLLRYNPETGDYEPHVAQSFSSNADKTVWTVKLREGVKFGNGDALTSAAVKFSVERMAKATVSSAALAAEVASIETPDPLTVIFRLKGPFGEFPYVLAEDTGAIVNPNVFNSMTPAQFGRNPKGAGVGPFEFERFSPNEEVVFKAKADYWGGPVCIDTLRFVSILGSRATYEAFKKGELQLAFLNEAPVVKDAKAAGVKGYENIASGSTYIVMNQGVRGTKSPFTDIRLRKAVAAAIDVNLLNQRVLEGSGLPGTSIIAKESPIFPGVDGPQYSPDTAKKLVAEAKAAGFDGKIRLTSGNTPTAINQTLTIQAFLQAVGFDVTNEILPSNEANAKVLTNPNFDLGFSGLSIFEESPYARLNQFELGSVRSRTGYGNAEMDRALDQLKRAATRNEKKAALAAVQRVWNETIPSHAILSTREFLATDPKLRGLVVNRDTVPLFHKAYLAK